MNTPVWMKDDSTLDERTMRFMAGEDVLLDRHLFVHDIRATAAHARGLAEIGLLLAADAEAIESALDGLRVSFLAGEFVLDDRYEDGHSAIESFLVERLGETGRRVHLGRSRNDQVLVALRLFMREALTESAALALDAADAALERARDTETLPMPGYTHTQRAVPSSVGLWMASFAESFAEDADLLIATRGWIDACPLGTAAGYGVNLPLPRHSVGAALGFSRLLINPMHAQATRGKAEVQVLAALWQFAQTIRRLAWDLTLFSTAEFGFVTLPPSGTTGSSIMPNKRNPDLSELLRAVAPTIAGCQAELQQVLALPSGYHRDLQATKGPLIRACLAATRAGEIVPGLLRGTLIHADRMRAAIDPTMYATDAAVELAAAGTPFRDAYQQVARRLDDLGDRTPEQSLDARVSPGATADLMLDQIQARIDRVRPAAAPPEHQQD